MREVILAKSAGFCFGVRRAVELAQKVAASGQPYVMLGPRHPQRPRDRRAGEKRGAVRGLPGGGPPGVRGDHPLPRGGEGGLRPPGCPGLPGGRRHLRQGGQDPPDRGRRQPTGSPGHHHRRPGPPEVQAIAGWCTGAKIFRNVEELTTFLEERNENSQKPVTLVSQTTSTDRIWSPCREKVKKECTNAEIFDTICDATCMRQSEAQSLAERCQMMIVIGDQKSSNTTRLAELCRAHCPLVYHISRNRLYV